MHDLGRELAQSIRSLVRRPGFTAVAVLTLALGIGASTTMFSVLHSVVLQPLPYPDSERVVRLYPTREATQRTPWTGADFVDFCEQASSYQAIAGYTYAEYSTLQDSVPRMVVGVSVTPAFFQVLGVPPLHGRVLSPDADPSGGPRAVVLSHAFWKTRLGGREGVVGSSIAFNGEPFTIAGVMPTPFQYPLGAELWVASRFRAPESSDAAGDPAHNRDDKYFNVVARLREGVSPEQAREEGKTILERLGEAYPDTSRGQGFDISSLHEVVVSSVRPTVLALFGAATLVLLLACANVAGVVLARAATRSQEMAVRASLGAERRHLARQLLSESLLLALAGGCGGALLALGGTRAVVALVVRELPRAGEITVSAPVLLFGLGASLLSGLVFGSAPLLALCRADTAAALRAGGSRSVAGSAHARARSVLVSVELAISLTLLVGVSLLARTLSSLGAVDPGFSEREVVTAQVWVPGSAAPGDEELRGFQRALLERVRSLPGVTSAAAVLSVPVDSTVNARTSYSVEGRVVERAALPVAGLQLASPGYFSSLGIPVLEGRDFADSDGPGNPPVMVVSRAFADRFFPGEDPIGKRVGTGHPDDDDFRWSTVVGVVGSTRHDGLRGEPRVEAYQPLAQEPSPWLTLVLKSRVPASTLAGPLRRAVAEVSPGQPVERIATMRQILHESLARERIQALLLALFAAVALALAAVGLYGLMTFTVACRTREIGIRIAVGADRASVTRLVIAQAGRLLLAGLAAGCAGAVAAGLLLRPLLFGVPAVDPVSLALAVVALSLAGLLAALAPLRRALATDPVVSLRSE